jgi:hypothetical protein
VTRYVLVALLVLIVLYGLVEAWPLIRGPKLVVESPTDHLTVEGGILTVAGRVAYVSVFTLNGAPLLYDQEGRFSSTLTFPRGGSILTFMAADRFGRTRTETRTIFVP